MRRRSGLGFFLLLAVVYWVIAPKYGLPLPETLQHNNWLDNNIVTSVINSSAETSGEQEHRDVNTTIINGKEIVLVQDRVTYTCNVENPKTPVDYEKIGAACRDYLGGSWSLNETVAKCEGTTFNDALCYSPYALELRNVCDGEKAQWTCDGNEHIIKCEC